MRSAACTLGVSIWLLAACGEQTDIVAHLPGPLDASKKDAGKDSGLAFELDAGFAFDSAAKLPGVKDAGPKPDGPEPAIEPPSCSSDAQQLVLIERTGGLWYFDVPTGTVSGPAAPECFVDGVTAGALDHTGQLWAGAPDLLLSGRLSQGGCARRTFAGSIQAMAFVYDPAKRRELLYFVEVDTLVMLEPSTLARTEIGPLQPRPLLAMRDGTLLSLGELSDGELSLDMVDREDATLIPLSTFASPSAAPLRGASSWNGSIALLYPSELYLYDPGSDAILSRFDLSMTDADFASVAANCDELLR